LAAVAKKTRQLEGPGSWTAKKYVDDDIDDSLEAE